MSLDLWLQNPDGDNEEPFSVNLTYNYIPMWASAVGKEGPSDAPAILDLIQDPSLCGQFMPLDGMTGEQSIPLLTLAVDAMESDMEGFRELNPSNGWGNADLFLSRLKSCLNAAKEDPDYVWSSWR